MTCQVALRQAPLTEGRKIRYQAPAADKSSGSASFNSRAPQPVARSVTRADHELLWTFSISEWHQGATGTGMSNYEALGIARPGQQLN
jgi:hypothetical protein